MHQTILATAMLLAAAAPFSSVVLAKPPNILFIYTDDQSHRTVSCYPEADPWVRTPNIDRLAEAGVRFQNAYAGPWCAVSRAMFLTGQQPHGIEGLRFGENPASTYDPQVCRFWPTELRKAGYYTGMIGKWHLSADAGHGRDWDYSAVWNHAVPKRAGGYYQNQRLNFNGGPFSAVGGYSTDNYTRYAIDFIERKHDKPWMLWLCYDAAHSDYLPAERHKELYSSVTVPTPADIFPPRSNKPGYMRNYGVWTKREDGQPIKNRATLSERVRRYNQVVASIDEAVGQLLTALKDTGQLDQTLVVFTSDQGFAWGQHGFEWKVAPYDANLRIPLIVRLPGVVSQNKVCRHPVQMLDLIPTFFRLAEAALPWEMHGRDLQPLLQDPDSPWDYPVLQEYFTTFFGSQTDGGITPKDCPMYRSGKVPWWLFLRQGKYKYIRTLVPDEIEELYDLEADPDELTNLAINPRYNTILVDYRQRLIDELKRTGARLLKNLPVPHISSD